MTHPHDNYSRMIFWLKIVLPLLGLMLLSALFMFSRNIGADGEGLPYTRDQMRDLADNPRMTSPQYTTVTLDGAAVTVDAQSASPAQGPDTPALADQVVAAYDTPSGLHVDVTSNNGEMDAAGERLRLIGDVVIVTSNGYEMFADILDTRLDGTELHSEGPVTATAPFGRIDAGQMRINLIDSDEPGYVVVFEKGVKLIYEIETNGENK